MANARPNIVLVVCHDLGRCLGCYGRAPIGSPNLDRLAGQGARFTNHFCTAPSCSPSRGSIQTGRYPHSNGLMGLVGRQGWELPATETTLPEHLKAAGYETYLFGGQHERKDAASLGYDHVPEKRAWPAADKIADSVAQFFAGAPSQPFYLNIGIFEPHRPFGSTDIVDRGDVYVPPYLPDDPIVRREMAGFTNLVRRLDHGVGTIVEALDANGLAENTLLAFTTDHGIDMPRAKGTLYDPGIETALLMRWPGVIPAGAARGELLSNVDLLPTLLQVAGLDAPEQVQGRSFLPLLRGETWRPREAIFAEKTHHCHYDPMRCIRTRRHKYIFNFGILRGIEIPADVEMETLASVPELYTARRPMAELYDLQNDPLETRNLSGAPNHAALEANLRDQLREWMQQTGDPLLEGVLPLPRYL